MPNSSSYLRVKDAKIAAFRELAVDLMSEVADRLCEEFDREVDLLQAELWQHRVELQRVAQLLGHQLGYAKELHAMFEQMGDIHGSLLAQLDKVRQDQLDASTLHHVVDRLHGQYASIISQQQAGVSAAADLAHRHKARKDVLASSTVSAEEEFNRIMALLEQPMAVDVAPQTPRLAQDAIAASETKSVSPTGTTLFCSCGTDYSEDMNVCRTCGQPRLAVSSRQDVASMAGTSGSLEGSALFCNCGAEFLRDATFCRKCGQPRPVARVGQAFSPTRSTASSCAKAASPITSPKQFQTLPAAGLHGHMLGR